MKTQTQVEQRRERKTEEQVIAEVKNVLEFARDFFRQRGKVILSQNCACQLAYFASAELFQHMEDREEIAAASGKSN